MGIDEQLCSSISRIFTLVDLLGWYKGKDPPVLAKRAILGGFTDTASAVVLRRAGEGRASVCVLLCTLYSVAHQSRLLRRMRVRRSMCSGA